jgi:hypothetical protein
MDTITFIFGSFITLLVAGSIGMLLWAAVEDGKVQILKQETIQEASKKSMNQIEHSNPEE